MKFEPMKPAPPVTMIFIYSPPVFQFMLWQDKSPARFYYIVNLRNAGFLFRFIDFC